MCGEHAEIIVFHVFMWPNYTLDTRVKRQASKRSTAHAATMFLNCSEPMLYRQQYFFPVSFK